MRTADVVIGANLGDEGKGLMVDFLAAPYGGDALIVRFCGGAQAGHTVTTPEGRRHVFNHFGSGSLCGSPTYLSRFFVCNPILFLLEYERLDKIGIRAKVYIDPASPVTTPYDMMINQMAEESRGNQRHGSCGVGVGETAERQQNAAYTLRFADLYNLPNLKAKLDFIRSQWIPFRLKKLGLKSVPREWQDRIESQNVSYRFVHDVEAFLQCVRPATTSVMGQAKHVIYEGAQGLLLDQDHEWFPHVTRSSTGLKNVITLASAAGIDALNVYYMSRCYATRHGAGPLPHELRHKPYDNIIDLTNVPNPHQGALRFGWLDLDLLKKTVSRDLSSAEGTIKIKPSLAITCLDQLDAKVCFVTQGAKQFCSVGAFLDAAATLLPDSKLLTSYGPTRRTMETFVFPESTSVRCWQNGHVSPAFLLQMSQSLSLIPEV